MTIVDVEVHREPPADFLAFTGALRFGTGSARYARANVAEQLARLADPRFLVARDGDAVVGGYAIDFRDARWRGGAVPGAYRGALGTDPDRRRQGIGRALTARAHALIDERAARAGEPVLAWGCIDAANAASLGLVGSGGAVDVGGLATWLLYRQAPRESPDVVRIDGSSPETVRQGYARSLAASLEECALADVTALRALGGAAGELHAMLEGERIVLAARVAPTVLRFDTLGAVNDALVRRLVMPFGFARRRFDPRAFRYLSLSDIVMVPDAERAWPRFVATLMARHGVHHALVTMDPSRALWRRLRKASGKRPGAAADVRVLARWHGADAPTATTPSGPIGLHPVDL